MFAVYPISPTPSLAIAISGDMSDMPDVTTLVHGPSFFTIPPLPEDKSGNEVPHDAAVEDLGWIDDNYSSFLPICLLIEHFLVHQYGPVASSKWLKDNIGEPITEKFTVEDFVHTIFVLSNYVHDEGWKTDGTKAQGKFTLKKGQKGQRGIHHLTSEGEELIQTLRRNWAKVTRDPVSSLAQ